MNYLYKYLIEAKRKKAESKKSSAGATKKTAKKAPAATPATTPAATKKTAKKTAKKAPTTTPAATKKTAKKSSAPAPAAKPPRRLRLAPEGTSRTVPIPATNTIPASTSDAIPLAPEGSTRSRRVATGPTVSRSGGRSIPLEAPGEPEVRTGSRISDPARPVELAPERAAPPRETGPIDLATDTDAPTRRASSTFDPERAAATQAASEAEQEAASRAARRSRAVQGEKKFGRSLASFISGGVGVAGARTIIPQEFYDELDKYKISVGGVDVLRGGSVVDELAFTAGQAVFQPRTTLLKPGLGGRIVGGAAGFDVGEQIGTAIADRLGIQNELGRGAIEFTSGIVGGAAGEKAGEVTQRVVTGLGKSALEKAAQNQTLRTAGNAVKIDALRTGKAIKQGGKLFGSTVKTGLDKLTAKSVDVGKSAVKSAVLKSAMLADKNPALASALVKTIDRGEKIGKAVKVFGREAKYGGKLAGVSDAKIDRAAQRLTQRAVSVGKEGTKFTKAAEAAKTGKLGGKLLGAAGTAFTAFDEFSKGTKYQGTGTEALNVATTVGAGLAVPAAISAAGTALAGGGLAAAGTAAGAAAVAAAPLAVAAGGLAAGAAAGRYLQSGLDDYEATERELRIQKDILQNASGGQAEKDEIRKRIDALEKQKEENKPGVMSRGYDATYGNAARGIISGIDKTSELLFGKETPESMRQKSIEAREKQLGPGAKTVQQLDYEAAEEAKKKMKARTPEQVAADTEREKRKEEIEAKAAALDAVRQAQEAGYEVDDETKRRAGILKESSDDYTPSPEVMNNPEIQRNIRNFDRDISIMRDNPDIDYSDYMTAEEQELIWAWLAKYNFDIQSADKEIQNAISAYLDWLRHDDPNRLADAFMFIRRWEARQRLENNLPIVTDEENIPEEENIPDESD